MDAETRRFVYKNGKAIIAHIQRRQAAETRSSYLQFARSNNWTYCGIDCTGYLAIEPQETPDRICYRCDIAYFNDEESED